MIKGISFSALRTSLMVFVFSRKIKYKEKNNNSIKQEVDSDDESRFNSEEYHKKQHDF